MPHGVKVQVLSSAPRTEFFHHKKITLELGDFLCHKFRVYMTGNRKRTITRHVDYITSVNPGIAEYSLVAALHGFSCVHQAQKSIVDLVQDTLELTFVFVRHGGDVLVNEDFQLL